MRKHKRKQNAESSSTKNEARSVVVASLGCLLAWLVSGGLILYTVLIDSIRLGIRQLSSSNMARRRRKGRRQETKNPGDNDDVDEGGDSSSTGTTASTSSSSNGGGDHEYDGDAAGAAASRQRDEEEVYDNSDRCDRRRSRAARALVRLRIERALDLSAASSSSSSDGAGTGTIETATAASTKTTTVWELLDAVLKSSHSSSYSSSSSKLCPLLPSLDVYRKDELMSQEVESEYVRPGTTPASLHYALLLSGSGSSRFFGGGGGYASSSSSSSATTARTQKQYNPTWYRCGYCNKTFYTRYYLDRHMDNARHVHAHVRTKATTNATTTTLPTICPATDWCGQFVPEAQCSDVASIEEPYYRKGSGGYGPDRFRVKRSVAKHTHSSADEKCDPIQLQRIRRNCYRLLDACFGGGVGTAVDAAGGGGDGRDDAGGRIPFVEALNRTLCGSISCPDRIQRLLARQQQQRQQPDLVQMAFRHVHDWRDDWAFHYARHHDLGYAFVLCTLLALLMWYCCALGPDFIGNRLSFGTGRRSNRRATLLPSPKKKSDSGTRLLRRSSSASAASSPTVAVALRQQQQRSSVLRRRTNRQRHEQEQQQQPP